MDLQPVKRAAGTTDYIPFKAIYNWGREAAVAGPRVAEMMADGGARSERQADRRRNRDAQRGEQKLPRGGETTSNELPSINDYWAKSFRVRLDELGGASPAG